MPTILDGLADPFERMPETDAAAALATHWGIAEARLSRLGTERDDSFAVSSPAGEFVLKIAHPADSADHLALQSDALAHAARVDPSLPLPRVIASRDGARSVHVGGRAARLLSWLPGTLLLDVEATPVRLANAGFVLGNLSRALESFEHPAATRPFAWDLQQLGALRPFADEPLLQELIDGFVGQIVPLLADLPQQIIHNDFHPGNLLVDGDSVVGVLDFGDLVRTARVCDLGVALAYLIPDEGPVWPTLEPFIEGYASVVPLNALERELIPWLVTARQVERIVINGALADRTGEERPLAKRTRWQLLRSLEER